MSGKLFNVTVHKWNRAKKKITERIKNVGKFYQFVRAGFGKFFFGLIASPIIEVLQSFLP
jgi:hypothetical protein